MRGRDRPAGHHPAVAHARRHGRQLRRPPTRSSAPTSTWGLEASPISEILIEESIAGWKEFELEVMRDVQGQRRHRLLDRELRPDGRAHRRLDHGRAGADADRQGIPAHARRRGGIIRAIGVDTGGSNIQFAVHPRDRPAGRDRDEPARVAQLGAGVQGDGLPDREDRRQAGRRLHARRAAQRHHARDAGLLRADDRLRRHQDPALHLREVPAGERHARAADEVGRRGDGDRPDVQGVAAEGDALARDRQPRLRAAPRGERRGGARTGCAGRTPTACGTSARRSGADGPSSASRRSTAIDPWFLRHVEEIVAEERELAGETPGRARCRSSCARSKQQGFSDARLAVLLGTTRSGGARAARGRGHRGRSTRPSTPAAPSSRPSRRTSTRPTSRATTRPRPTARRKIVILGGGPNRIGQGIEFDYCCVHAALALREDGFETIMVNCNPETVSTDYDTSDKLFFEPLTLEDVLALHPARAARRRHRPVRRPDAAAARGAARARRRADHRHVARLDRPRRGPRALRAGADGARPEAAAERHRAQRRRGGAGGGRRSATRCWCVRPTCSAGARWRSSTTARASAATCGSAVRASPEHPVLIDQFLEDAIEVDVDAVSDGTDVVIGGIMEHIERAGVHSGDSACSLPPYSIDAEVQARHPPPDRRARPRARCRRPHERAVRRQGPAWSTCSR